MSKPNTDPHDHAAAAMRAEIARAIRGLISQLEREGRAAIRIPALKVEGREQLEIAARLRDDAKRTGWA